MSPTLLAWRNHPGFRAAAVAACAEALEHLTADTAADTIPAAVGPGATSPSAPGSSSYRSSRTHSTRRRAGSTPDTHRRAVTEAAQ